MLNTLVRVYHVILITTLQLWTVLLHLTDEGTEIQRG